MTGDNTTCGNATAGLGECALGANDTCATTNALALQVLAMAALPEAEMRQASMALMGCDADKAQQLEEMMQMGNEVSGETGGMGGAEAEMPDMSPLLTGIMADAMGCESQTECSGVCVASGGSRRLDAHGDDASGCEPDMSAVTAKSCGGDAAAGDGDDDAADAAAGDDDDDDAAADTTSSAAILAAIAYLA